MTESDVFIGLTRIRLQLAIYFCLHGGSLPEKAAGRQRNSGATAVPKNFRKKLYVSQNRVYAVTLIRDRAV
jgi:hypothetical protein